MKKYKICHLTSVHPEADTRIFIKECRSLRDFGWDVHYIVPGVESKKIDGVHIHGIPKENSRMKRMFLTSNKVYKASLSLDADIYHFHDPELIPIGMKLKKLGKCVIYDIHEDLPRALLSKEWIPSPFRQPLASMVEFYENYAAKKFDYLVGATPFITKRFKKINNNTANINNYPLLNELNRSKTNEEIPKKSQLCYVGVLGIERGMNQLLEAANLIKGTIHIAGKINSKEKTQQIETHKNIKYLGVLNRLEVKELLTSSIAGIVTFLPEPNHINAQPNKMFEYMSAGIPVICSDFPLWKSIIEKHNCGICVDPKKPSEIASAINYLLDNPDIAEIMGKNGRNAVENEYNWEQESEKLNKVYSKLISS
ncbi:hypothetical protein AM499_12095 [Bacillus sp. FJAT-22090]|nr:hypothetical protein AM499_12095 [Bacillus sp. FJAT-22090]